MRDMDNWLLWEASRWFSCNATNVVGQDTAATELTVATW